MKTIPWQIVMALVSFLGAALDATADCPTTRCGEKEPEIRFPFIKLDPPHFKLDHQHMVCSLPGFNLTCTADNRTILKVPYSADVYVKSIDYDTNTLQIQCPFKFNGTITPLNLSSSPFRRTYEFYEHLNYSFFNCGFSDALRKASRFYPSLLSTDCYGRSQIYAMRSYDPLYDELPLCERLKTTKLYTGIYNVENDVCCVQESFTFRWVQYSRFCDEDDWRSVWNVTTNGPGLGTAAITGIVVTVIIFSATLAMAFYYWKHKFGGYWELDEYEVEKFLDSYQSLNPNRYSFSEVKRMTNHFRQKLGEGGYGSVYRGRLPNGLPVAVKTLETFKSNGNDFLNEVATIGRVHHVNVVRLLGFCAERFRQALIYEFMPNGSLEKFIFSSESKPCELGWDKLHEIAVGIARGIEYLHQGCDQRILHFDIKPHNILLDHKFTPKLSDFGLAKLCSKDQSIVSMTVARGTAGYIAPEVMSRNFGNVSYKSDVYSFGMLLLEMVGKRKNIDVNAEHISQVNFSEWVYNRVNLQQELGVGVPFTAEEDEIAKKLVIVALWCIQLNPVDRPNMKKVVQMMEGATELLEIPPNPFVSCTT